MQFSRIRQAFWQEIHQPDPQISLARAALLMAQEEYPELDIDEYLNALDTMAEEIRERLSGPIYPMRMVQAINRYLFEDLRFKGNTDDYYDPRNSFLNDVLDRRIGIPITLSLIYVEIAARLEFPMVGVGMPGHFLVRPMVEDMSIFVDPFHEGEILFEQDCVDRLQQVFGQPIPWQPHYLDPVSPRHFLVRMLRNLKQIYLHNQDLERAASVVERILLLSPDNTLELRDRGVLYYTMGRWGESRHDLEDYLVQMPRAGDAARIRRLLRQMQA